MPPRTEMLRDSVIGREKALGVSWRFEPLHALLPLPGGLMRVLGAVVKIAMLTMFYTWQDLALSRSVPLQLIGDDHAAFKEEFFHIPEAEAEPKVQPHSVTDNFNRKAMILIFRGSGRCLHATTLPHHVWAQQVDDAILPFGVSIQ